MAERDLREEALARLDTDGGLHDKWTAANGRAQAIALIRIGDALERVAAAMEQARKDEYRCPHGYAGLCMLCVRDGDLLRPR